MPNSANLIVESAGPAAAIEQQGRTLNIKASQGATATTIRVGAFHPYLTYEASFSGVDGAEAVGITFYPNNGKGETIRTLYTAGR